MKAQKEASATIGGIGRRQRIGKLGGSRLAAGWGSELFAQQRRVVCFRWEEAETREWGGLRKKEQNNGEFTQFSRDAAAYNGLLTARWAFSPSQARQVHNFA
ncbi:hypothetical protein NIA71_09990 [Ihubacter massiliensis]|uniref:Uncharacterized protein n=1 Tax=Hominibacterium faecale TaxID=2839743 RepID=A0A9J6QZN7_9FIRM|nr:MULTISPECIES: hypothetical protein [Eubacteriales Family XIII. Incertae Sedis]MCI7302041.1 hypothetical protein [Clostridia bacterium]MDE8732126.1 hypothetical protein [Eubacteriales bacterium DFI.9.88]MDY3010861.1 hypothetical protein [Clostridiales Family XIII bacterium]MCO7122272.1 hypothetical protein [Ihubacter massiliensis]MCU7380893.1 hypothetical protein [Hominibacterium faecale]